MLKKSFSPIVPSASKLLLLGSLPGDRSLATQEYYAHPQNRFWKILATLFSRPLPKDYSEKLRILQEEKIALWDVCETAQRVGSMDTAIIAEIPNAIDQLLDEHPTIKAICFNGQKAEKLYDKYFARKKNIQYITLPSTSPANASFNQSRLLEKWDAISSLLR